MAVDEAGNIVIGEYEHIRRVDSATNTISTIAGNGSVGWSGDYGQATAARIVASTDLAFEAGGNLISAQYSAGRLRRITGVGCRAPSTTRSRRHASSTRATAPAASPRRGRRTPPAT
ncbi:MAG: hypothetical protein R2699_01860 [Acidimicrobiales bacterium]